MWCQLENWHDLDYLFSRSSRTSNSIIGIKTITVKSRIVLLNAGNHPALITSIQSKNKRNQSISGLPNSGNIYIDSISPQNLTTIPLVIKPKGIEEIPIKVVLTCEPKIEYSKDLREKYLPVIDFMDKLTEGIALSFSAQVQYVSTTIVLQSKTYRTSKTLPLSYLIKINAPSNPIDRKYIIDVLDQTNTLHLELRKKGNVFLKKQIEEQKLKDQESAHHFQRKLDKSGLIILKKLLDNCEREKLRPYIKESKYVIYPDDDIPPPIAIILPRISGGLEIKFDLSEEGAHYLDVDINKVTPQCGEPAFFSRSYYISNINQIDKAMHIIMRVLIERNASKSSDYHAIDL